MSLGIGLCLNQTKAVLEGFFTDDIEFKRTPKLGVDENGNGARNRNGCAYKVPKSVLTFLEAGLRPLLLRRRAGRHLHTQVGLGAVPLAVLQRLRLRQLHVPGGRPGSSAAWP